MKKVGILTFHRAHNYGAVLQCYALQEVLKGLGHNVCVIDYRQPFIEKLYAPFSFKRFFEMLIHPRGMYGYIKRYVNRCNKEKIYQGFLANWLNLSEQCDQITIPQNIVTYVIGSDQLWSLHCTGGIVDSTYFGNFKHNSNAKIIGYAISSNIKSIDEISTDKLRQYASNFSTLSFRESSISDAILDKCGIRSRVDIDPTLLTDASTWSAMINDKWAKERYVLLYQVRHPYQDKDLLYRKAAELANQLNCKVIDLSDMKYSVEDFVSLFKYAQSVVTSSFHASVFSVIFERPLYAVKLKDGHDGRYENILKAIGAESFLVDTDFTPVPITLDYTPINEKLRKMRQSSFEYLQQI